MMLMWKLEKVAHGMTSSLKTNSQRGNAECVEQRSALWRPKESTMQAWF